MQLLSKRLSRLTMETEAKPVHYVEKEKYWNRLGEAYGCLCLSISRYLLFHINGLNTPKEIWDKIASLFDKQDDLRIYQLENELISLHPSNFETLNYFFTKLKRPVSQLKLCKVEKEDDQLILAILSKLGAKYSFFVSTFHSGKLTTPNWRITTLNSFIEYLTQEHDKLIQMGIIRSSIDQALVVGGPKATDGKGKQKYESLMEKE